MTVYVIGFRDDQSKYPNVINTTTSSKTWSRGLSPMILGPVKNDYLEAKNVENAWQFSKVYPEHIDKYGEVKSDWYRWSSEGFKDSWAHRYPMGKGAIPEFAYYGGERLDYIESRKKIYIPIYEDAAFGTDAFTELLDQSVQNDDITLLDYDGYDYLKLGMTLEDVVNDPTRKMGHAFVLAMMLS